MKTKIFKGEIEHTRYWPVEHSFRYALYVYAFDLDELPELARKLPLFGYNRHHIAAIFDRDYLFREKGSIREKISRCLEMEGIRTPPARVLLITSPRYLNYVFNPVSFYFCYTIDDALLCVIAEVSNTYGERHVYVLKEPLPGSNLHVARYTAPKAFHVSPYNRVEGKYEFAFSNPEQTLDIKIKLNNDDRTVLEARLTGRPVPLSPVSHLKIMLQNPIAPHLNIPRIYREAFKLSFFRKMPFNAKPIPVSPKTIRQEKPTFFQAVARKIVAAHFARISNGHIRMRTPDGAVSIFGRPYSRPSGDINVRDFRFFTRSMRGGEIGFGESYTAGEWDSPDLPRLLKTIIKNRDNLKEGNWMTSAISDGLESVSHYFRKNRISGSRENIYRHYDLGNAFFKLFLDETMTYSCAFFRTKQDSLENAQRNKYQKIIEKADIQQTDHLLEIGCGWGGFALEAAKTTGCRVTAVTNSEQQYRYVREKISMEGLDDRIGIHLQDYRNIASRYDKIVSIEMLEAVGHRYFGSFFKTCDRLLKKNGLVVIQTIVNPDRRYRKLYKKSDWLKKHIFPGGQVPSLTVISDAMTRHSRLLVQDIENIGDHYAITLNRWRRAFLGNAGKLTAMGLGPEFQRKWDYYLALCEAAFSARALRDLQIVLSREGSDTPKMIFQD